MPIDKKENLLLAPLSRRSLPSRESTPIDVIYDDLKKSLKGRTQKADKANKQALSIIFSNLVICSFSDKWLSIPDSQVLYQKDKYYKSVLFLSQKAVRRVLEAITQHPLLELEKRRGNSFQKVVNTYRPKGHFKKILQAWIYVIKETYSENPEDYLIFKEPELEIDSRLTDKVKIDREIEKHNKKLLEHGKYNKLTTSLFYQNADLPRLHKINTFLSKQIYALQQPIRLIYGHNIVTGGRLYCATQTLPDKKTRIRINTKINNQPVCEVDFKANHLRMLAALGGLALPEDPYLEICRSQGLERHVVKSIILKMIGASDRSINQIDDDGTVLFTSDEKEKVEKFLQKQYPTIYENLYSGYGVVLQSFEGQILLDAMCALVDKGIPSIPVHDSLMVPIHHANSAKLELTKAWLSAFDLPNDFPVYLDIDLP